MKHSLPDPDNRYPWAQDTPDAREIRIVRIERLERRVKEEHGNLRNLALRELVKLRNYERLLHLKHTWWPLDHPQ